ncbi:MAG TPA: hypothetical protein VLK84_00635 [Longimicrobium sp.]|nr:hypothetical protein [Longimicrobium sp.]
MPLSPRRTFLGLFAAFALAGCGGGDEPAADVPAAQAPAQGSAAAQAAEPAPAKSSGPLTLADAERAGFTRTSEKAFRLVDATDGAGGMMGGDTVEIYVYAGTPPEAQLTEMRSYAGPGTPFGWAGVCEVGNLVMLYQEEAACRALRGLR